MNEQSAQLFQKQQQESTDSLIQKGQFIRTNLKLDGEVTSAKLKLMPSLERQINALNKHLRPHGIYIFGEIFLHPEIREWVLVYKKIETTEICVDNLLVLLHDYMRGLKSLNEISAALAVKDVNGSTEALAALGDCKFGNQKMEDDLCQMTGLDRQALAKLVRSMCMSDEGASIMTSNSGSVELQAFPSQIAVIDLQASTGMMPEPPSFQVEVLSFDPKNGRLFVRSIHGSKDYYAFASKEMRINPPQPGAILSVKESNDKPLPLSCVDLIAIESPRQISLPI